MRPYITDALFICTVRPKDEEPLGAAEEAAAEEARKVGRCRLTLSTQLPKLKLPGAKRLKLKCDEPLLNFAFNFNLRRCGKAALAALLPAGRGLRSSTFQLNLSRFGHTSRCPLSNRLGEIHAPNASHKMCLR